MGTLTSSFWVARFLTVRFVALIYLLGFLVFYHQLPGLLGSDGIYPAFSFIEHMRVQHAQPQWVHPSLLYELCTSAVQCDAVMLAVSQVGIALSVLVLLGVTNAFVMVALWALYMSMVNVGQVPGDCYCCCCRCWCWCDWYCRYHCSRGFDDNNEAVGVTRLTRLGQRC